MSEQVVFITGIDFIDKLKGILGNLRLLGDGIRRRTSFSWGVALRVCSSRFARAGTSPVK
jgi:hypothetical protein